MAKVRRLLLISSGIILSLLACITTVVWLADSSLIPLSVITLSCIGIMMGIAVIITFLIESGIEILNREK